MALQNLSFVLDISIIKGERLIAKDIHWLTRKKTTSDPYIRAYYGDNFLGKTKTIEKTLNPIWNWQMRILVPADDDSRVRLRYTDISKIRLHLFDKDKLSDDDFMGEVCVPVCSNHPFTENWYNVGCGDMNTELFCKNATGRIRVRVEMSQIRGMTMEPGCIYEIPTKKRFDLKIQWNNAGQITNLDNSCVAIDSEGNILMDQSVYSGQLANSNESVRRSDLNCETKFSCNLQTLGMYVQALYFILIVETPVKTFKDLKIISAKISDETSEDSLYQCTPKISGEEHTAMFLMRFVRGNHTWNTTLIESTQHTGRDFRTLTSEVRECSRDIINVAQLQNA